jgi:hypothetical protein
VGGVLIYSVVGVGLIYLSNALTSDQFSGFVGMFVVAFVGTMTLLSGPRAFMTGWCLIYWFLLIPLLHRGFLQRTVASERYDREC